jgi:glutamate formiminotransferase
MAIIESIPNISEGRSADLIDAIANAVAATPGVRLLDRSSDASHNRTVLTLAGPPAAVREAILTLYTQAIAAIDLRQHHGEHPRLGAVDVVPFVPIDGVTMADCVALARDVAAEVGTRFALPVYLYEDAATDPSRRKPRGHPARRIRRAGREDVTAGWAPDAGPAAPHPRAGATVIGARMPLIAYNINLASDRLDVAKKIAAAVRHSSGGLRYVKAMGVMLEDRRIAQVSMNLTNYEKTPLPRVFEFVKREAARTAWASSKARSSAWSRRPRCSRPRSTTCRSRVLAVAGAGEPPPRG